MRAGVVAVDAAAEYRDRPARFEGSSVRSAVDAAGESRYDDDTCTRETA
jgi:hypothetical protein